VRASNALIGNRNGNYGNFSTEGKKLELNHVAQKPLWDAMQPVPPLLRDVVSRLEAALVGLGFVRCEYAMPTLAMFGKRCRVEGHPPGRMLVLSVGYVDEESPAKRKRKRK
jgi:hypothetical protein